MTYAPSLTLDNSGWGPPHDFMLWNPTKEQAFACVAEAIDVMVANITAADNCPVSDLYFNVCFDSNNHFVVMYG